MAVLSSPQCPSVPHVLRIDRVDDDHQAESLPFVLLNIVPTTTADPSAAGIPTDALRGCQITATDGVDVFVAELTDQSIADGRANGSPSVSEWASTLAAVLFERDDSDCGIDAVATVVQLSELRIGVRRKVDGITQRLGTVVLPLSDPAEIDILAWASDCAIRARYFRHLAAHHAAAAAEVVDLVSCLRQQLDELVDRKRENDKALLDKFSQLLSEKKKLIRQYQATRGPTDEGCRPVGVGAAPEPTRSSLEAHLSHRPAQRSKRAVSRGTKRTRAVVADSEASTPEPSEAETDDAETDDGVTDCDDTEGDETEGDRPDHLIDEKDGRDSTARAGLDPNTPKPPAASQQPSSVATVRPDDDVAIPPRRTLPQRIRPVRRPVPVPGPEVDVKMAVDGEDEL